MLDRQQCETIRKNVRKYCKDNGVTPTQLSDETGISRSATSKLLSKPSVKTHTKFIRKNTAELLSMWLEDKAKEAPKNPVNAPLGGGIPSEGKFKPGTTYAEVTILKLEEEVEAKDRVIHGLKTQLSMYRDDAETDAMWAIKYRELRELYDAQTKYLSVLLAKYNAS